MLPAEQAAGEEPPGEPEVSRDLDQILRQQAAGAKRPDQTPHAAPGDEAGREALLLEHLEHTDVGESSGATAAECEGETGPPSRTGHPEAGNVSTTRTAGAGAPFASRVRTSRSFQSE